MNIASGAVIAGRYRLEKRLAVGGMGSLWTAQHTQLDTQVAIKFMDANHAASATGRQRFEREAKMAASLKSAHVVQVHDYGVEDDRPYIVMELLQGEDLGKRLKRDRRLSLQVTSGILTQIARGLRRAHDAGLIHRDLKPPNIFMARGDDDHIVKILDFGIAKDTTEVRLGEGTKTGELMGSPHFMSPEQIRGAKDIDHRSDLWSLGVILFRAVTGALPFQGDAIGAVIAHILADPIPAPSSVNPGLSPAIDAYFARAFAREKSGRFQSAREMAETFAQLAVEASVARSTGSPSTYPAPESGALPGTAALFTPAPFTPNPFTPAPIVAGLDPVTVTSTGGPLIQSAMPPPTRPTRSGSTWLGVGAFAVLIVGSGIGFMMRGTPTSSARAPTIESRGDPLPATTAIPLPSSAEAAASSAVAAPNVDAAPSASAEASAASPAGSTSASAKSATVTPKPAPAPAGGARKKPTWGF